MAVLGERALRRVDQRLGLVAAARRASRLLSRRRRVLRVGLGDEAGDLAPRSGRWSAPRCTDCSLPVPRSLAATRDDAVGVDVERRPGSAARRAAPAGCRRARSARATCCRRPSRARPAARARSTNGWLSTAVEKTSVLRVGIVVLRGMSRVNTPPAVSTPSDSGVTSSSSTSCTSPLSTPPWIAAPTATTSSGFDALVRRPCRRTPSTTCCTRGMRVWPPTRMT